MTLSIKTLAAAGLALSAVAAAVPANAQVSGNIGVVNAPATVAASNAVRTGFTQVATTYATQIASIQQKQQQAETLLKGFDKNNDGQLDQAEQQAAQKSPQATQVQTLEREIGQLSNQVDTARVYVVDQILQKYSAALQTVVTANKLQLVLGPEAVAYSAPAANINEKVVAALNTAVPSVQIVPPQGWQPTQQAVAVYQQVQQIFLIASARQQAAAQTPAAQPAGR